METKPELTYREWILKDSYGKEFTYWVIDITKDWLMCKYDFFPLEAFKKPVLRRMNTPYFSTKQSDCYYGLTYTPEELEQLKGKLMNMKFTKMLYWNNKDYYYLIS